MLAMGITTLRTNLKIRDRVNELEFLLYSTIRDLKVVEKQLGIKDDKKLMQNLTKLLTLNNLEKKNIWKNLVS